MDKQIWKVIGLSWLSLKTWVKAWLFFLNIVFILSLFFWDRAEIPWVLSAYASSGPLLLLIAYYQRGLTRLIGIAHIIPWIPLVIYIVLSLSHLLPAWSTDPYYVLYLLLLLDVLIICLSFDLYDIYRWYKGHRYVMGSKEAHRNGASGLRI